MENPTASVTDSVLARAKKDTGFTKGGGFTLKSETIEKIVSAIKKQGNIALSPSDFGVLIEKDVSKSKNPVSALQTAFNKSIDKDYPTLKTKGLKASIRRQQGKDIETTIDGKKTTVKEGLIALCMEYVPQEAS